MLMDVHLEGNEHALTPSCNSGRAGWCYSRSPPIMHLVLDDVAGH